MQDYYGFLIDMALDMKDFEWIDEIKKIKKIHSKEIKSNKSNIEQIKVGFTDIYNTDEKIQELSQEMYNKGVKDCEELINEAFSNHQVQISLLIETIRILSDIKNV